MNKILNFFKIIEKFKSKFKNPHIFAESSEDFFKIDLKTPY